MKVIEINTVLRGSTGHIMQNIAKICNKNNIQCYMAVPKGRHNKKINNDNIIYIGNRFSEDLHLLLGRLTGFQGCFSYFSTKQFLKKIKKIKPDIIHLHNLHNCYINLPLLFEYIKKNNIKVVWTLHDCWSFTGKCPHFQISKCNKWKKDGCNHCPQYKNYPQMYFDNSKKMYNLKKKWFLGVKNLTLVTPSKWLLNLTKQSFLKPYPIKVINNGVDLNIFKPVKNNFREQYNIQNKYILLGVAFPWSKRKGLDVFCELSKRLENKYQIVIVGTNDNIDKLLPNNIIAIHKTNNQQELAKIYSAADLFINPTKEENYPTVNMESIACGTPVLTFDTGGSKEMLDNTCGDYVDCNDIDSLIKKIKEICETKKYSTKACQKKSKEYNMNDRFEEYIKLYKNL